MRNIEIVKVSSGDFQDVAELIKSSLIELEPSAIEEIENTLQIDSVWKDLIHIDRNLIYSSQYFLISFSRGPPVNILI